MRRVSPSRSTLHLTESQGKSVGPVPLTQTFRLGPYFVTPRGSLEPQPCQPRCLPCFAASYLVPASSTCLSLPVVFKPSGPTPSRQKSWPKPKLRSRARALLYFSPSQPPNTKPTLSVRFPYYCSCFQLLRPGLRPTSSKLVLFDGPSSPLATGLVRAQVARHEYAGGHLVDSTALRAG